MWYTYILKSKNFNKYYIGHCEDFDKRLSQHNNGKTKSIKAYIPYELIYYENFDFKKDAYRREMQIKKYKGGEAFKKLLKLI
jgi:putative endonuclease